VLDLALTLTLGRSIITSLTTMFAVLALFFFTTGSMKDLLAGLLFGMVSGVYRQLHCERIRPDVGKHQGKKEPSGPRRRAPRLLRPPKADDVDKDGALR